MKKLILTLLLATTGIVLAQNFEKGVDFTGVSSVTASRLNNLVDLATPATGKGLVIATNNTPDTTTYPYFTNFIWLDRSTVPPAVKVYGTNWASGTVAPGSVTSAELAADAVISGKIAANAVWTTNINDNAITEPKIAAGAVTSSKLGVGAIGTTAIADYAVTTIKIATNAVVTDKIASGAVTTDKIATDAVTATQLTNAAVTQVKLASESVALTNYVSTGVSANQYLRRNAGNTAFEWGVPIVYAYTNISTHFTNTTAMAVGATAPTISEGNQVASLTFTPKSANSVLVIEAVVSVSHSNLSGGSASMALFEDSGPDAISAKTHRFNASSPSDLHIRYSVVAGSTTARTYSIRVGPDSGSVYINGDAVGTTAIFASTDISTFSITEFVQ